LLNTCLRIFYWSFPLHKSLVKDTLKGWLIKGIQYCKILTNTIQLAKKLHYNKLISQSSNKTKTAWNVINSLTNKWSNIKDEFRPCHSWGG
jgi:hypothetical protein